MTPKLSEDEVMKLVHLYHERECLWDPKCETYRNKQKRAMALEEIRQEMDIEELDIIEIKTKIKNLRSAYYLELNKIEKSIKSGSGNIYVPRPKWFHELDKFIKNVYVKKVTMDVTVSDVDEGEQDSNTEASPFYEEESEEVEHLDPLSEQQENCRLVRHVSITPQVSQVPPRKRKLEITYEPNEQINKTNRLKEPDEFDLFGKLIAVQLRKMPEYESIICQEEIQSILRQHRLSLLSRSTNHEFFTK